MFFGSLSLFSFRRFLQQHLASLHNTTRLLLLLLRTIYGIGDVSKGPLFVLLNTTPQSVLLIFLSAELRHTSVVFSVFAAFLPLVSAFYLLNVLWCNFAESWANPYQAKCCLRVPRDIPEAPTSAAALQSPFKNVHCLHKFFSSLVSHISEVFVERA